MYAADNTSDIVASSRPAKDAAVELSGCDLSDSRGGASVDRLAAAEDGPSSDQTRCDGGGPGRDLVPCTPTSWSRGALQPINHPRSVFPRSSSSSPDRVTAGGHDCNACLFCACQRVVYGPAASSNNGQASPVSTTPLRSSLPTVYRCRRPFPSRPAPPTHHLVASLITLQQQLDSVARKATTNQPATYLTSSNGCLNKQRQS